MAIKVSLSTYPIWDGYSNQEFEDAYSKNRLEELVKRLAMQIGQQSEVSNETKLETACRAICMIPSDQTELINVISAAIESQKLWKFAQEGYFNVSKPYYDILTAAQEEAVTRKNLPAALELVSKIKQVHPSLKQCVLKSLPEKTLITRIVEKDQKNSVSEKQANHITYLGDNGYMFVDPHKANFSKNSNVLNLLADYEETKRALLAQALSTLITFCDEAEDIKSIVQVLNTLEEQLEECVQAARLVLLDGWSGTCKAKLIQAICELPEGRRVAICQAAYQLSFCSRALLISWKSMEQHRPVQKKVIVQSLSKKDPDRFSYRRYVLIFNALKDLDSTVLDPTVFADSIAAAKAYLDASQLLNKDPISSHEICEVIEAIKKRIFRASDISHELMQFSEPRREWILKIYRKRRLSINEFPNHLPFFKKTTEAEMKAIYGFFKQKKHPLDGWNQKFDSNSDTVWNKVLSIPPGEIEDVLRGTQLLMRALSIKTGHEDFIFAQLRIEKNIRKSLTEKLFLLFSLGGIGEEVALRLVLLVSKLLPEQLTKEIYDVLLAFEKDGNENTINELLKLPTAIFSKLSFHYYYEPIDTLGQEHLKSEILSASANYNFAGLRSSYNFPPQPLQQSKSCTIL